MDVTAKDLWSAMQVLRSSQDIGARAAAYETVICCAMGGSTEAVRKRAERELARRGISVT